MKTVADIMTRQVLTVAPETPVHEAALEIVLRGFHGAPVRDPDGRVVGVLSTTNLVDTTGEPVTPRKVGDVMAPVIFAVLATDPAMDAVQRMVETGTHRLVVVDEAGKLVGLVTPMDVLQALLDGVDLTAGWTRK